MCHSFSILFWLPAIVLLLIGFILIILVQWTMLPYSFLGRKRKGWIETLSENLAATFSIQLKANGPALIATITDNNTVERLRPFVETEIDKFLREKLPAQMPMIAMFIGDKTINQLKGIFTGEIEILFPMFIEQYANENLLNNDTLNKKIATTIYGTLTDKLPLLILKKGMIAILLLGLIGLLIGLLQYGFMERTMH